MLEASVESYLVKRIEAAGGVALKGDIKGRRFIDRICIMPDGVTAYVELKRSKAAHKRAHQVETIKRLVEMGHIAYFVSSRDGVDTLMAMIRGRQEGART